MKQQRQYTLADLGFDACLHDQTVSEGFGEARCVWCNATWDAYQQQFFGGSIHHPIHPLYQEAVAAAAPALPAKKVPFQPSPVRETIVTGEVDDLGRLLRGIAWDVPDDEV